VSVRILEELHRQVRHLLYEYHVPAQAGRFVVTFLAAVGLQVRGGATVTGWSDLVALLAGAGHVAYRQWRKTLPAKQVLQAIRDAKTDAELAEDPQAGHAPPGP